MYWLLPFKGLKTAKSRWNTVETQRTELVIELLQRSLETVSAVAGRDRVFLVTPDIKTAEATGFGYITVDGNGLNADLNSARDKLISSHPPSSLAVLLPDLPNLTVEDVESLSNESQRHPVVLCPDTKEIGTNAIALSPWDGLDFLFEGASFQRFQSALTELHQPLKILRRAGLAEDCDEPSDLERYCLQ